MVFRRVLAVVARIDIPQPDLAARLNGKSLSEIHAGGLLRSI
jgi:hypothetical protein